MIFALLIILPVWLLILAVCLVFWFGGSLWIGMPKYDWDFVTPFAHLIHTIVWLIIALGSLIGLEVLS